MKTAKGIQSNQEIHKTIVRDPKLIRNTSLVFLNRGLQMCSLRRNTRFK